MTLKGKPKNSKKDLSHQSHFVHHKSYMYSLGLEPGASRSQAGVKPP
jgi:hypothetical protein